MRAEFNPFEPAATALYSIPLIPRGEEASVWSISYAVKNCSEIAGGSSIFRWICATLRCIEKTSAIP